MAGNNSAEDGWRGLNVLTCSRCNLKTSDSALLQAHHCKPKVQQVTAGVSYNKENNKFTCSLCRLELPELEFSQHLEAHVSLKPYLCSYCSIDAATKEDMIQHIHISHEHAELKFIVQLSLKTKDIMLRAKSNGSEFYRSINVKDLLSYVPNRKSNCVTNTTQSQQSVAVSSMSQKRVEAPSLHNSIPSAVSSTLMLPQSQLPPIIQQATLGIPPHLSSIQNFNVRTCSNRPLFPTNQQRVIILGPSMTTLAQSGSQPTLSTHIPQTQVPASLPFVPVPSPNIVWRLASSWELNQAFVSNNFSVVGPDALSGGAETHMASLSPISSVSKVYNSTTPPVAENFERRLRDQNLVNHVSDIERTDLEHSVRNESGSSRDSVNSESHIITSPECQEVPNPSAHTEQGCSLDVNFKRGVSTIISSDSPIQVSVENVMSLPDGQDDLQQNIASGNTLNTEPITNAWDETAEQQRRTIQSDNFSFLRVVKGYFLCLICRMKWCTDYDLFFKHIWQKHVHGIDFSCCPMGYSTSCVRLKAVVSTIYDKSQEPMSDLIKSYFMTSPSIDLQAVNESTDFPEKCVYSSASHSDSVCVSASSSIHSQSNVETDVRSTSATFMSQGNVPYILSQMLPMETATCYEEINCPPDTSFHPEKVRTSIQSYGLENGQNQVTCDLTSDIRRGEALQESLEKTVQKQTRREAIASTPGIMETLKCLPEQQQMDVSSNSLGNTVISMSFTHQESNNPANVYEDISNDGYNDSSSIVNKISDLLSENNYAELPLDLSKKAPQPGTSPISVPLSVNEAHVTGSITRLDRISTDSLETTDDDETSLKFFYQCGFPSCLFASSKSLDFQVHYQQAHDSDNEFPCIYCGFNNASSQHLINHMEEHLSNTKTKTFSCSLLENSDKVAQFENNDIKFILKMLNTSFAANSDSDTILHCACNICRSEFIDLEELEEHLQKSLLKVIECKYCESYFLNCYSWQKHMTTEHIDLPQMFNISKKLLCYDRKMSRNIFDRSSCNESSLYLLENTTKESEITAQENECGRNNLEPPVASVIIPSVFDTETTRVLGKKYESQNLNSQKTQSSIVQSISQGRILKALPVDAQIQGINYKEISANLKSKNVMELLPEGSENAFAFINTLGSFGGKDSVDHFHTNLQTNTVSTSRGINEHPTHTVSPSRDIIGQPPISTVNASRDIIEQPSTHTVNASRDINEQLPTHTVNASRDFNEQLPTHTVRASRDINEQLPTHTVRASRDINEQLPTHTVRASRDINEQLPTHTVRASRDRTEQPPTHTVNTKTDIDNSEQPPKNAVIAVRDSSDDGQPPTHTVSVSRDISEQLPTHTVNASKDIIGEPPTHTVSASRDINEQLPTHTVSASREINEQLPTHTVSASRDINEQLPTHTVSASRDINEQLPTHTVRASRDIDNSEQPSIYAVSSVRDSSDGGQPPTHTVNASKDIIGEPPTHTVSASRGINEQLPTHTVSASRDINEQLPTHTVSASRDRTEQPPTHTVNTKRDIDNSEQPPTYAVSSVRDSSDGGQPPTHTVSACKDINGQPPTPNGNARRDSSNNGQPPSHAINDKAESDDYIRNVNNVTSSQLALIMPSNSHQANFNLAPDISHLTNNCLVMETEGLRMTERDEHINRYNAISQANAKNVITNSLEMDKTEEGVVTSGGIELLCREKTVLQDIRITNICTRAEMTEHCLSVGEALNVTSGIDDSLKSSAQQCLGSMNYDSVIVTGDQNVTVLKDGRNIISAEVTITSSANPTAESQKKDQELTNLISNNSQSTADTHVNGNKNSLVFSQSKTEGLRSEQIKSNKLIFRKNMLSKNSASVNREEPATSSDMRTSSDDTNILEENHKDESFSSLSFSDIIEGHYSTSNNIKKIASYQILNPQNFKQSKVNCQAYQDHVLPQKSFIHKKGSNGLSFTCKCDSLSSGNHDPNIGKSNHNIANQDQSQVKPVHMKCSKCRFVALWSSFRSKSILKPNRSSHCAQNALSSSKSLSKTSSEAPKNASDCALQRLIDECGSTAMDQCLKSLYTASDGQFVCKRCKQHFISLKIIHCHSFYCQGKVGVFYCSDCLYQGEHEEDVVLHIKHQHCDKALNITVKHQYFQTSELMEILQSQSVSPDNFMEICAKLPPPKHADNNNGTNSSETSSSKKSVNSEITSEKSSLNIIPEKKDSLISTEHHAFPFNSAEEHFKMQATKVSSVISENNIKVSALATSNNYEDCTSVMGPLVDNVKSPNPCTTLPVISGNVEQPKMPEISTVMLSDKIIVTASEIDEENITPDFTKSEKKSKIIYSGSSMKRMSHSKRAYETRKSGGDIKVSHSSSAVKEKSDSVYDTRIEANETTTNKEIISKSKSLVDNHNDKISVLEITKSDNMTKVNSNGKILKEKSDRHVEGIRKSETTKLDHVIIDTPVSKQSEKKQGNGVSTSKTVKTSKDIAVSLMGKLKLNTKVSEITKSSDKIKICPSNSVVKTISVDVQDELVRTVEMANSDKEIKISHVGKTVRSSLDRFDETIMIQKTTEPNKEMFSQTDTALIGKSVVRHETTRTSEATKSDNMNQISHVDRPLGKQPDHTYEDVSVLNATKSAKESKVNHNTTVNRKSETKMPDKEINDTDSAATRKSENGLSAERKAAKTTKSDKEIKTGHCDKAVKQNSNDRHVEVICPHGTRSDNKIHVKCNDAAIRKSKSVTVRSDKKIETDCIGNKCMTRSDESHNKGITGTEAISSNTKIKTTCNDTTGNSQLVDKHNEGINTPHIIRSDNEDNSKGTESRLSGNGFNKVGHDTINTSKAAKSDGEISVQYGDSAARRKAHDKRISIPETSKLSCNGTMTRRLSEGEHNKGATEAFRQIEETKVSHSDSLVRRKSLTVQQEGINTPKTARTAKEMKVNRNDTIDKRNSGNHMEGAGALKTRSDSQINDFDFADKRKLMDGQDECIRTPEINCSVIKLCNIINDTETVRQSENRYDESICIPSDKLTKVINSDAAVINQSESEHDDDDGSSSIVGNNDFAFEIMTDDTFDEHILTYKFTKINKGASITGKNAAVKRKSEERLEEKASKRCRSDDALQSSTEIQYTGLAIPDSATNSKSSAKHSIMSYSNSQLKKHIKSNNDKSEKVSRVSSSNSQPVPSDRRAKKRKRFIYKCIHLNCDFMCEWNMESMKEHINKKHPYYSCGYCNAPYTLLVLLNNHQTFVHRGMKPCIVIGTISLHLLFKRVDECNNSLRGDCHSEAVDIKSQSLLEFSPKRKLRKCKIKSNCELTTSKNCEERAPARSFDVSVTSNQPDVSGVGSKMSSGLNEKPFKENYVSRSVFQARKSQTDKIQQSKPESILEQFQKEVSLASRHGVTTSEKLTSPSSINAVSNNVNSISPKTDRNLFERSFMMNTFETGASNANKATSSKLMNTANKEDRITEKSSTVGNPFAEIFKLRLPIDERIPLKKSVQNDLDCSHHSQSTEMRERVNKDLSDHQKLVQYSAVLKATVCLENLPPNDALKNNSGSSPTSQGAYSKEKIVSKSAVYFNKFNKVPKFKAAKITAYKTCTQQRIPSIPNKTQDFSLLDISQETNLSAIRNNDHANHEKTKRTSDTLGKDFSDDMLDDMKTTAHKIMTPRSSLKTGSEKNYGTWTVSQLETKTAAEGTQNMEFEPENMRTTLRECITLQNINKVSKHSGSFCGKNLPSIDAVLGETSRSSRKGMSKTEYPFRCTLCSRTVKCLNDIEKHFQECHQTEVVKLTERISGFVYSSSGQCLVGKDHRKAPTHSHMCRYCPFRSTQRSDVEDHIRTDHPSKDVLVFSLRKQSSHKPGTSTELSSEIIFPDPAPGSNSSTVTYYHCVMCDSVERSEFMFRLHLAKHPCFKHTSLLSTGASFVCPTCGYITKSRSDLAQHTGEHMSERRFKCFMCEHDSHNKHGVKTHIKSVHNLNMDDYTGVIDRIKQRSLDLRPRLVNINPQVLLEHL